MFIAAIFALFVLLYTYFAYPILIALCARVRPMQVAKDPEYSPMVSAIIPVYNAKEYIAPKLDSLLALDYPSEKLEIILLSDCSDDGSDALIEEYATRYPGKIRLLRAETRSGKPSAINAMRREATGEVLLMTDIRQELHPECLRELVTHLADPNIGAVSGNLELRGAVGAGFYWKYEKWIRQSEAGFRSLVGVTGAIYGIRAADLPDLPIGITLDDMWVPMRLRLQGKRIAFAKNAIAYDEAFDDDKEFGRKTRTLAGNYQLFAVLPKLLLPLVNPSWFETFSHKILRLVCPWALIALALLSGLSVAASPYGGATWQYYVMLVLAAGQVGFYLLAFAGKRLGKLGNIARTFVIMNYAALVGLWKFVSGGQKITW